MQNDEVPLVHAFRAELEEKLVVVTCPFCGKHHTHDVPSRFTEVIQHQASPCTMRPYNLVWHPLKSIAQAAIDILRVRDEEPERLARDPEVMRLLCAVQDEVSRLDDQPGAGWRHNTEWRHVDGYYPKIPAAVLVLLKRYCWALPDPHGHTEFDDLQAYRSIGEPVSIYTYRPTSDSCPEGGEMTYAELWRLARVEPFKFFISQHGDTLLFNEDAHAALVGFCHAVYGEWARFLDRLEWRRTSQSK
jgi:hypothetical protein